MYLQKEEKQNLPLRRIQIKVESLIESGDINVGVVYELSTSRQTKHDQKLTPL